MKQFILCLTLGVVMLSGCNKESLNTPPGQDGGNKLPTEESAKNIKSLHIEHLPTKTVYVLNEALNLKGISVRVTLADHSAYIMEEIPEDWIKGFSSNESVKAQKVTLHPTGSMEWVADSFTVDILPLKVENGKVTEVTASSLKILTLPEGITAIADEAFGNHATLEEVVLPGTLTSMGSYVFFGSAALKKIDLSRTKLTEIPSGSFESCANLSEVLLPGTLKAIGGNAFYGTSQLKHIIIPEGTEEIGFSAFTSSGIIRIELPNTLRLIQRSFYKCGELEQVATYGKHYSGNSTDRSILGESFQKCPKLETLEIPGGVNHIGISVLGQCKVKKIVIPENVEKIDFNAFGNALALEEVIINGNTKREIDANAFPPSVRNKLKVRQEND